MNYELAKFKTLCDKAQEMIFDVLFTIEREEERTNLIMYGIPDDISGLTPLEQIFFVGNTILGKNLYLLPQTEIRTNGKRYIADFVVEGFLDWQDRELVGDLLLKKPLVIELDGKEYHSTKKQMNYDYARENDLKLAGYDVMRFTGSQVYNDIYGCVQKVFEYVKKCEVE